MTGFISPGLSFSSCLSVSVREYAPRWLCPEVVHLLPSVFFRVFRGKNKIIILDSSSQGSSNSS